ncbi:MAG TPA: GDSL-type esterase/lipase family protein [Pseudonocardiaceae bacterium]
MRAGRARSVASLAVIAIVILFTAGGDAAPTPQPPKPGPPTHAPLTIVSLGDSTVSGEGAGDYDPGTDGQAGDWCHRSAAAEIHETTLPGVVKTVNLACSGANTTQVGLGTAVHYTERSQTAQLAALATHDRVVAIVVAVGANDDPRFSQVLDDCVHAWASKGSCSAGFESNWQHRTDAMVPKVAKVLRDIRSAMAKVHYQPDDYQLVLQSYAAPIGPNTAGSLLSLDGCPFREVDLRWVRSTAVRVLDEGLRKAATDAGTRFLDLASAGLGHEACSGGGNNTSHEWFTRLTVAWQDISNQQRVGHALQESFHPNARGQSAFGGCLSQFLATNDQAAACLGGANGVLHPAALAAG